MHSHKHSDKETLHSIFSKDASTTVASENNYFNHFEINFLMLDHSKEASVTALYTLIQLDRDRMHLCSFAALEIIYSWGNVWNCFPILQFVHYSVPPHVNQAVISFFFPLCCRCSIWSCDGFILEPLSLYARYLQWYSRNIRCWHAISRLPWIPLSYTCSSPSTVS